MGEKSDLACTKIIHTKFLQSEIIDDFLYIGMLVSC